MTVVNFANAREVMEARETMFVVKRTDVDIKTMTLIFA